MKLTSFLNTQVISSLILFAALTNLSACSTDIIGSDRIHTEDIHQYYQAHYRADDNTTDFTATFRVGGSTGTTIEFLAPSELTVNDIVAKQEKFFGSHYTVNLSKGFIPNFRTIWRTQEGQTFTNSFSIKPIRSRDALPTRLYIGTSTLINLIVPAYQEDDEIEAIIEQNADNNQNRYVVAKNYNPQTQQLMIQPTDLINLKPGVATFYLRRTHSKPLEQQTPKGGLAFSSYSDVKVTVSIEL
jgi:hypothetical protein